VRAVFLFMIFLALAGEGPRIAGSIDRLTAAIIIISEQHKPIREPGRL